MKSTTKTSTIRANGVQVTNLRGNQTMYSSDNLFFFGALKKGVIKGENGRYTVIKSGQYATLLNQPFSIEINQ